MVLRLLSLSVLAVKCLSSRLRTFVVVEGRTALLVAPFAITALIVARIRFFGAVKLWFWVFPALLTGAIVSGVYIWRQRSVSPVLKRLSKGFSELDPAEQELKVLEAQLHHFERAIAGVLAMSFIMFIVFLLAADLADRVFQYTARTYGLRIARILLAVTTIGCGVFAHWLKGAHQKLYGGLEVLFGIVTSIVGASRITVDSPQLPWVTTIAGAYIIARGLNNWREAANFDEPSDGSNLHGRVVH